MKLKKISLSEIANTELNEKEMSRILGGGAPGCCQCGCNYATSGGSSTSANDSANRAGGYTSDPGAHPCCSTPDPVEKPQYTQCYSQCICGSVDVLCGEISDPMC